MSVHVYMRRSNVLVSIIVIEIAVSFDTQFLKGPLPHTVTLQYSPSDAASPKLSGAGKPMVKVPPNAPRVCHVMRNFTIACNNHCCTLHAVV